MGSENVKRILWHQPPLTDVSLPAWRCLLLMASRAHDKSQLYFAGVEWLQLQMGYQMNEGGRVHVMGYIKELEKAGYVWRTGRKRGRKTEYQLRVTDYLGPVDNP